MAGKSAPGTVLETPVRTAPPERHRDVWKDELVRTLGRAGQARGRVGTLDLLARAGLPVPEGVVLTARAHEEFLRTSGVLGEITAGVRRGADIRRLAAEIRRGSACIPLETELNREICEALIGLYARAVVVLSDDLERRGLESIPEVRDAVRNAWLSQRGLERQLEAAARGEALPTWPVLAQRELRPRYTGWSTIGVSAVSGSASTANVALYDVEPVGEGRAESIIDRFTLEAAATLGEPVDILWGLEEGRWYVLSAISPRCGERYARGGR
jgi:hypothetical protein